MDSKNSDQSYFIWLVIGLIVLALVAVIVGGAAIAFQRGRTNIFPGATPGGLIVPTSPFEPTTTTVPVTAPPQAELTIIPSSTALAEATGTVIPAAATSTAVATLTSIPAPAFANVDAVQLAGPITVDGILSDWPQTSSVASTFRVYNRAAWDGSADINAVWSLSWDSETLYVAVVVTDDIHVQIESGNQIFRGDSVDLQIDTDRAGDYGDGLNSDDFQIIISPGDFASIAPSAFRFTANNDGRSIDFPGHQIQLAATERSDGYLLEIGIPWADINIVPEQGMVIGAALNVNDNDLVGTAVQEVMNSHVSTRKFGDPRSWGTITLR